MDFLNTLRKTLGFPKQPPTAQAPEKAPLPDLRLPHIAATAALSRTHPGAMTQEQLATLVEQISKDDALLRQKIVDGKDRNGSIASNLADSLRTQAVAHYVLRADVVGFKTTLTQAVQLRGTLFERFDAGEAVSPSYVSMLAYKNLFDALATGDFALAQRTAKRLGGRQQIEASHDNTFTRAIGYALKYVVLGELAQAQGPLDTLTALCEKTGHKSFGGYPLVLRAIIAADTSEAEKGLAQVLAGHKRLCSGANLFSNTEDELLCVWGLGLANLAHAQGLPVRPANALLPTDLITDSINPGDHP